MKTKPPAKRIYDAPAIRIAARLVSAMADSDVPLGVNALSRLAGTNTNMAFRALRTLVEEGWVVAEGTPPGYRLSLTLFALASKPVRRTSLQQAALGPLEELWRTSGESCYLSILDGNRVLHIQHLDGTGDLKVAGVVGGRYYLHTAAPGKVLLAHAGEELVRRIVREKMAVLTEHTIATADALRAELAVVRRDGYALDREECALGLRCAAAPIADHTGKVVAAIGLSVPSVHYTIERIERELVPLVRHAAARASTALGGLAAPV